MPNEIISKEGMYLRIPVQFTGKNGTWKLIGSKSIGFKAIETIDTFKNIQTGEYIDVTRGNVYENATNKLIW